MVEMADQSQQESRKRIVNFYLGNIEKGKSFTSAILKERRFAKSTVSHFLQSFEDRKTANKKAGSGKISPKPPAQARKCLVKSPEGGQLQEAWFKTQLHVVLQLSVRNTEALREEGMTFHKRKKALQPPQPWKRGNMYKCSKLLPEHIRQDGL